MARGYIYRRPVKRSHYSNFRRNLIIFIAAVIAVGVIAYLLLSGLHQKDQGVTSAATNTQVNGNLTTFTNDYFQFQDTGTWVLSKHDSSSNRIVYNKYLKNVLQAELIVYINQTPYPLLIEVPRVLPVRMINENRLTATTVSNPCVSQYAKGELHKVKEVTISGALMLCDPDATNYSVILSEIGGDYTLNMKRPNGKPISFVITYKDDGLDPQPDSILSIASTFKTR